MFDRTEQIIEEGIAAGLHPGAQLYVSRHGQTLLDDAFGEARPGVSMSPDSITLWMSAGKPLAAIAAAQLIGRGLLSLDEPVAGRIPEFAQHGKGPITLRHLLTHTGGFRGPMGSFEPGSWAHQVARACALKLEPGWVPGEKAGYHPGSAWFILGELIRLADPRQRSFDQYVRDEIFVPLNQPDASVGLSTEGWHALEELLAPTVITDPMQRNVRDNWNDPAAAHIPRPGANARGPIRALAKVYESLLAGGARLLDGDLARLITARHRAGLFDHTFKCTLDFGLGFLIDSKQYAGEHPYGYGAHASSEAFGHSGNQSSCAFADPVHGLVVAWVCTGMPGDARHDARQRAINAAVYEDLGLA